MDNIALKNNQSLFNGLGVSDCLKPCLVTTASVEQGTSISTQNYSMVGLMFNEEVRVKRTSVDKFIFWKEFCLTFYLCAWVV